MTTQSTIRTRLPAVLRLARWQEHLPFTLAATVLGANMTSRLNDVSPDARIITVTLANILAVTFAFMINDIEDAPDDARDPARRDRNAIAAGELSAGAGRVIAGLVAATSVLLFATLNHAAFVAGSMTVALSWLYSWRAVRLKAWPVVDVVSHLLMLSTLLFLSGYLAFDTSPGRAWWVAAAVGLISAYGQLYNQARDFAADRAAGLLNTAGVLGYRRTLIAMYGCLGMAILLLIVTAFMGLWPWWLGLVILAYLPVALRFRSRTDMRGAAAIDRSGRLQLAAMLGADVLVLIWLVARLTG